MKLTKGKVISALLALLLVLLALFPIPATSESGTEEQAAIEITIPDEEPPEEPEAIQIELDANDDEPAQEGVPEIEVSLEETEDDLPDEEPTDELVIEDIQITEEVPVEPVQSEEPAQPEEEPADLAGVIAAHGYAYAVTAGETKVYGSSDLAEDQHVFTIAGGQPLLATAFVDGEICSGIKIWFITGTGEAMTGYVPAQSLEEAPHDADEANVMAAYGSGYVDSEVGVLLAFVVQGDFPQAMEETAPDDMVVKDVQIPDEEESAAIEVVLPDEQEDEPIPAEPETTEEHEEIPDSKQMLAEIGDFAYVTTNTRAFMEVDESAADDYYGDYFLGYFLKDAAVQVEDVLTDFLDRTWYNVSYVYGPDEGDGLICEIVGTVYVLAEETEQTDLVERTATDYGYPPDYFRPMLLSSFYVDLEDHYGGVASFYVGESGLHATTGHDNEYKQIARHDEYGTIFATPHYLKGETAYCLEHTQPSPVVRDHASGPYQIVDLDGYKVTPGHSGYIFSDKTMHALAWVLRHTYPFMVLDRSDSDNEVWCRVAGQFAMREVIKQLEGDFYVMDYWEMDEFYRAYDQAPGVYLDYARWLAEEALAYVEDYGNVTVSNKSVSASGGKYIGTATLYTSADRLRISTSVGTVSGHSGGSDGEYYYVYSGDTISITSSKSKFSVPIEIMPSADDEARFYVGVTYEDIQKLVLPVYGEPYPILATSLDFEVPHGSVTVSKKSAQSGALLPGAVFELLSSSGSVVQTQTTGANGTATFSNLTPGTYSVREKTAPQGYLFSATSSQSITVTAGVNAQVSFSNEVSKSKIRIIKTDSLTGDALPGAEFTVTRLSAPSGGSGVGSVAAVLTTGADGTAETGWIEWGRYRIEETKVPEHYEDSGFVTEIDAYENGRTYEFSVKNTPVCGYIQLTKTDAKRGTPLSGVQFDIYHNDAYGSGLAGSMTTDESGIAYSGPLRKGTYRVEEHANPEGYTGELTTLDAVVKPDETTALEAENQPIQGKIRIVKTDQLTGEALAGAEFTITRIEASPAVNGAGVGETTTITTGESGIAETGWLDYGTYRITETVVPEHFVDSGFSVEVDVHEDQQTYTVDAENEPTKGYIQIVKTDRLDQTPIEGVQFDIYYNDEYGEGLAATMTTNADGVAVSEPLRKGRYIVREHDNPTGYVSDLVELNAAVKSDETTYLSAENEPIQGQIRIVKTDELTGEALAGAEFTITRISGLPSHKGAGNGDVVAVLTTDSAGIAVSPLLTWGVYRVEETKVPEHFVDNGFSVDVTIDAENMQTYEVAAENEPTKGYIRITKTDRVNGNPIAGVRFDVYHNDQYGEGLATSMVTDENGVAVSEPIRKGRYIVRESGVTTGYHFEEVTLDTTVRSDETTELAATNMPVLVKLRIYKRDAGEMAPKSIGLKVRGDGILTGAEFQVFAAEDIVDRQGNVVHPAGSIVVDSIVTEGDDAAALTDNLWPGLYEIVEVTPPEGYHLSSEPIIVDARSAAQQSEEAVIIYEGTKSNEIMTGAQAIVKILGSGDHNPDPDRVEIPEPGAEFEVYLKRAGSYENARDIERDYLVTDENGYARTKELPYGVYVLRQTVGKDGYELKSAIEFKIDGTEDLIHPPIMTLSDRPILYRLRLIKTDAKTGKVITLPGASFKLKDADGNYVRQTVYYPTEREIDTFTTDDSGAVTLPETVGWGLYFIEEVKAPQGYLIRNQELAVFVGRDGDTPDGVYELDIEIPNDPVSGRIVLHKKGLQMTGVHEEQDEYGNAVYTPVFEERYLAGAVFEVRAAEDIVGGDGTIWHQKDELVDTIVTTADGGDASKELPLGRYVLIETQMPDGYVGFAERYEVDLAYADEHTAVVEISTEIHNAYVPAEVTLTKVKEIAQTAKQDDLVKQEIIVVPGEGFVFGLYVQSDIPYSGGTLMADTLVATGATDADGKLILSGMFPHGDYYLKELSAPDGWKMSAERYPIRISAENRAEDQAIIRVGVEEPILNRLVYTPVTLAKTDITGENTVPGALIVVRNSKGEIVYQAYTDENGEIPDMPLTPGDYTFREILAPEGYELNEAEMAFTVHEDGTVTGDTSIRDDFTRVQLIKHDENGRPLADTQFILSDESGRILKIEVSDENGLVTFDRIPYGTFVIEESRPLNGYLLSSKKVTITVTGAFINPSKPLDTFVNYPNEAVIRKVDQKGKALPGAVFGLFDENGKRKMTAVSDEKGIVRFTKIPHGDFTIREIEPPNGYLLCKEVVNLTIDDSYVSSDTPITTLTNHLKRVRYQKVDTSGKYLPGVEFSLINAETGEVVETVVSDDHGEFVFTKFDYGDWIIRETKAPEGFNRMDDLTLHVDENWKEPEPFTCVNIPNYYEFIKTDNRRNPIPGVKFALEDEDGNFLRELVSGDDGIVRADNLTPGKYVIRETEAAEGYTKTDEVIEITIDENYVPPKRLKRLKNYSTIQTGVEIEMTPVMWAGAGLMAVTAVVMVVYAVRSRKCRK